MGQTSNWFNIYHDVLNDMTYLSQRNFRGHNTELKIKAGLQWTLSEFFPLRGHLCVHLISKYSESLSETQNFICASSSSSNLRNHK